MTLYFVLFSIFVAFTSASFQRGQPYGLDPGRAPFADVESKILDARSCRDNYRIATNRTTTDLAGVIELSKMCALYAANGIKFLIATQNLTSYQLRLFREYGYTVSQIANNEQGIPQFNITWRLNV